MRLWTLHPALPRPEGAGRALARGAARAARARGRHARLPASSAARALPGEPSSARGHRRLPRGRTGARPARVATRSTRRSSSSAARARDSARAWARSGSSGVTSRASSPRVTPPRSRDSVAARSPPTPMFRIVPGGVADWERAS
jgi:hypothetical protein